MIHYEYSFFYRGEQQPRATFEVRDLTYEQSLVAAKHLATTQHGIDLLLVDAIIHKNLAQKNSDYPP